MIRSDFAAFIITFNRPEILHRTITHLYTQTVAPAKILIVNNGEKLDFSTLSRPEGIDLEEHIMGFNSGPAGASHFAMVSLASRNFKWIQWIDDDDPPRIADLNERLFNHLEIVKDHTVGIIAPVGSYFNTRKGIAVRIGNSEIETNPYLDVQTVGGNQCMLINSAVIQKGCLPTSSLFFGFEETNFCLKVLQAGYRIVVPCDLFYEYRNLAGRWGLKKADIRKIEIPAWRNYYSIRNLIYMFLYEFKRPRVVINIIGRISARAFYNLIKHGPSRGFQEFYYTFLGIRDGVQKKLGLTVTPLAKH
jgi:GT2 family glycosyltransferase